nr:glycoside hydrolase family 5 protein [Streptomyces sp. ME19-01-6]
MQPSWNLGNTLDAIPDETSWGNPKAAKALFDTVRAQGYRSVRIPVTWSGHQSSSAPYTIDATWMSRVKQVVDWAQADGLYVVINVHHDSWQWINTIATNHDGVLARFKATWTQIAAAFKNYPQSLLFESNNESRSSTTPPTPRPFSTTANSTPRSAAWCASPAATTRPVCSSCPPCTARPTRCSRTRCTPRSRRSTTPTSRPPCTTTATTRSAPTPAHRPCSGAPPARHHG